MEAPLRHINCRHLTLESADKLTNMSWRIQDTTYFAVFLADDSRVKLAICFCYINTEGCLHSTSLIRTNGLHHSWEMSDIKTICRLFPCKWYMPLQRQKPFACQKSANGLSSHANQNLPKNLLEKKSIGLSFKIRFP